MFPSWTYFIWTQGNITISVSIPLNYTRNYVTSGFLTQRDGDDYSHVYISTVCHYSGGDVVSCGVRDFSGDLDLGIVEYLSSVSRITIKLRSTGGRSRAEGIIFEY